LQKKSYHILFIPEDNHKVRKFRFSHPQLKFFGAGFVFIVLFAFLSSVGFFYYRSLYLNGKQQQLSFSQLDQQQSELVQKLSQLEENIARTEEMAKKMESQVVAEQESMAKGFGPVDDETSLELVSYKPSIDYDELVREDTEKLNAELGVVIYNLDKAALEMEERLAKAYEAFQDRAVYLSSTPSVWPVRGWLTSKFGLRRSPWTGGLGFHEGLDIASQWGSPVYAPADGVVTFTGAKGGFGRTVVINHGFGVSTRFGHLSRILVQEGQKVVRGVSIARVGNTGHSTGPHLHYEVHVDGAPVDPMQYLHD
jgi:murein DD-endopeptidase MepM/ murein hydrolase activator NlpD